ncbi:MAG TPA: hypothetical protein VIN58_21930, partial [Roseateles sp.]
VGLTQTRRGFRLPRWQFEPKLWDVIPELTKALQTTDGWTILSFLETPLGGLGGSLPGKRLSRARWHGWWHWLERKAPEAFHEPHRLRIHPALHPAGLIPA